jgi:hypothetical protein
MFENETIYTLAYSWREGGEGLLVLLNYLGITNINKSPFFNSLMNRMN